MYNFKRPGSVFTKLVISYTVLIVVITVLVGVSSYLYLTRNFNKEVEKVHLNMLDNVNNVITISIFQKVESISLDIVINNNIEYISNNSIEGNHSKISDIYQQLQNIVIVNSDLLQSIYLYYPENDIIISYPSGIKYLKESDRSVYKEQDWFKKISNLRQINYWMVTRPVPDSIEAPVVYTDSFTYIRSFPLNAINVKNGYYVIVNIKESAVRKIISEYANENKNLYVIDSEGHILSNYQNGMLGAKIRDESLINRIVKSQKTEESFIEKVEDITSVVTFTTLKETGWRLINISSVNEYYKQSYLVGQILIIICIIAVITGFIISGFFVSNIYNPLKSLINNAGKLFRDIKGDVPNKKHEYAYINNVINTLSLKVNNMESILSSNKPLIKHSLVIDLLNRSILTEKEMEERLKLLDISFAHPFFATGAIKLDTDAINSLSEENK